MAINKSRFFSTRKEKLTSHVPKLIFGRPCQITMTSFFKRAKTVRYAIRMSTHESKQAFPLVRRELARRLRWLRSHSKIRSADAKGRSMN